MPLQFGPHQGLDNINTIHAYASSLLSLIHLQHVLSKGPYLSATNSAELLMNEMVMVVAVEVVRVFIIQTVKGFGGPIEVWRRNGEATESAALPNELEWPIEAGPF